MRTHKKLVGIMILSLILVIPMSCTDNFEETNIDPVNPQQATIEGIMAGVQYFGFAEPRFITWRGNVIYSSRFAHQFSYNATGTWFGADVYQNNQGWTNGVFDNSYQKVSLNARNLLGTYVKNGDTNGAAVSRIMMSWFYQKMTDIYGDVPYSDVIGEELILEKPQPSYDPQKDIYTGILNDLKAQMDIIGTSTDEISGAAGDYLYQGDVQKWRTFANTLRLRTALRSRDAFIRDGEQSFIDGVINECLSNELISESNQALLNKSTSALILSFLDGSFEDVYWGFGGVGSKWVFSDRFMDMLKDNNDPRMTQMAAPSNNGTYNGSPVLARAFGDREDLAIVSEKIIGTSTTDVDMILPTQILTAAESHFLQAEAALLGYSGDAQASYRQGITASMSFWGVDSPDIDAFKANEVIATLAGTTDQQLNMVWNQRWLALLTNGYEAWALVRRTNLIPDFTDNSTFFVTPPNNGVVPRRLPYSTTEAISNTDNLAAAITRQGADAMTTNIWWDLN